MFDIDSRASKFEKEKQKRINDAKRKLKNETILKEKYLEKEQQLVELAIQRKEEQERIELQQQAEEAEELRITGGVLFNHDLKAYFIEGDDDKVVLSEECLQELTNQDAFSKGVLSFQLQTLHCVTSKEEVNLHIHQKYHNASIIKTTFCGVREFSGENGMIGIPKKVAQSLSLPFYLSSSSSSPACSDEISSSSNAPNLDGASSNNAIITTSEIMIRIKYMILPKCAFVKLQPKEHRFFDVGPVKLCLEQNLQYHSTLCVGDLITVWYRGSKYDLHVIEMKPDAYGSLVNTDVEVELELSEEYINHKNNVKEDITPLYPIIKNNMNQSNQERLDHHLPQQQHIDSSSGYQENLQEELIFMKQKNVSIENYQMKLFDEPIISTTALSHPPSDLLNLKIKLPINNLTKMRRFLKTSSIEQLFIYIITEILSNLEYHNVDKYISINTNNIGKQNSRMDFIQEIINKFKISTRFPLRNFAFEESNNKTFEEIGLMNNDSLLVTFI